MDKKCADGDFVESPNTPSDLLKSLILSNLAMCSPNVHKISWQREFIFARDFNVNVKGNYNAELVRSHESCFPNKRSSGFSRGITLSNSCIYIVS
jgi:hypothetical protein